MRAAGSSTQLLSGTDFATGYIELGWFDGAAGNATAGTIGTASGPGSYSVWARTG